MAGKEVKKGAGEMIVAQGIGIQTSGKDKENEGFQSLIEEPQNLKEGAGETIRETQISKMDLDKQRSLEAHHRLPLQGLDQNNCIRGEEGPDSGNGTRGR